MAGKPDFLNGEIPQLIRQLAIPVSVGMFFNTMYNVVDTWYAGVLSTTGIAALTLSFPVFFAVFSAGHGIATATTAIVAGELGKSSDRSAAAYLAQSIGFSVVLSVFLAAMGIVFVKPLLAVMSSDSGVVALAQTYLQILFLGVPFMIVIGAVNAGLTARGDTRTYRNILIAGFLANLALNPLFMFGVAPLHLPAMGVRGIALATALIQVGGLLYIVHRAKVQGCFEQMTLADLRPHREMLKLIVSQSLPAATGMLMVSVGIFIITSFVSRAGDTHSVAAYGVAMRIEQIALLPTIGLGTAMLAITGQNSGAGQFDRIRDTYRTSLRYGAAIMAAMLALIVPFAPFWISLFDATPEVIAVGTVYLRVEMITFYAYFAVFLSISLFQGLKRPMIAVWLGLYRQVVAPLTIFSVLIYGLNFSIYAIWWGICAITWSAAIFALLYSQRTLKGIVAL
ncbi:MAG: MATE family efflux transporter [Deltaproteobacteria bacterium]|nr:MATE family efflux transporter [Deltaproteobacteria bacterium]